MTNFTTKLTAIVCTVLLSTADDHRGGRRRPRPSGPAVVSAARVA